MPARIIGIGQAIAGDDAAGIAAIGAIREMGAPPATDLAEVIEPTALVPMLTDGADPVVLIDAVVGRGRPGTIVRVNPGKNAGRGARLLSTHGLGVLDAIELARILHPESAAKHIVVLGITISRTNRKGETLSPAVLKAVRTAAVEAIALARNPAQKRRTRRS